MADRKIWSRESKKTLLFFLNLSLSYRINFGKKIIIITQETDETHATYERKKIIKKKILRCYIKMNEWMKPGIKNNCLFFLLHSHCLATTEKILTSVTLSLLLLLLKCFFGGFSFSDETWARIMLIFFLLVGWLARNSENTEFFYFIFIFFFFMSMFFILLGCCYCNNNIDWFSSSFINSASKRYILSVSISQKIAPSG